MGQCKNLRGKFINCYLSSKKQIRPPPSLSAWQRYHSFWHVLLWETTLFSLLFYITFLFELEVQTGFQFFIDFSDSLQNGVYSTTKIRSFSSIKFKFMLLVFFFYILDWKPLFFDNIFQIRTSNFLATAISAFLFAFSSCQ